jgi:hypothetical protein
MASKSPKSSIQLYGGGDREPDQRTRQWRAARIDRFTETQKHRREWINFKEVAEYCSEESGIVPNEVAREAAYQKLQRDLLEGDFEENGRSRVLYLHPSTVKAKMTRDWLSGLMEIYDQTTINSEYLAHCWIPREFFDRWLAKHRMQPRPERFEPKGPTPPTTTRQPVNQAINHGKSYAAPKGPFGPERGKLRRYEAADRELFPELEQIMAKKQKSRSAAALDLAQTGRIAGVGTPESRAKRLAALYKRERPRRAKGRNRRRLTSC